MVMMTKNRNILSEKPWFFGLSLSCLIAGALLITTFLKADEGSRLCSLTGTRIKSVVAEKENEYVPTDIQLQAIIHYATSKIVPQQSIGEITVSFDVLQSRGPSNFLVFGLGHDSLMWASLNPRGNTLFLEEDPKWVQTVLKKAPQLRAHYVKYRTQLREADDLLATYKSEPKCSPSKAAPLKGNERCRLALDNLPAEVYEREWDLIMIDAPRGYFPEAPGRMAAIFSAAVMARNRKGSGVTHVFLHDVDRKVEKTFAEEFLCRKYRVKAVGRLWHFEIPAVNASQAEDTGARFC
ncbi:arabinogalactan O-methyltransferase 1-like [Humulus lupulus]|uniref:arabinogalactan O-methyltransferase 1-like n=1 Tax=Humulus lupulus TaxID=3486 RepID=UPI002B40647F|nr:arabinogalactan O-methyltransferase 1-like [Humulus lupulus]